MKKFQVLVVTLGLLIVGNASGIALAGLPGKVVNERQQAQRERIRQGVQSGELNKREAYKLRENQQRIARYERRSRADGNGINAHEAKKLDRMQDRQNKAIHHQKHDQQDRH